MRVCVIEMYMDYGCWEVYGVALDPAVAGVLLQKAGEATILKEARAVWHDVTEHPRMSLSKDMTIKDGNVRFEND